jgi:hypothetical protein
MRNFTNNMDLCFWLFQMEFLITRTPCPGSQFLFTSLNPKQTTHQMWCKINSSNPPVLCKFPTKEPKLGPKTITFLPLPTIKNKNLLPPLQLLKSKSQKVMVTMLSSRFLEVASLAFQGILILGTMLKVE